MPPLFAAGLPPLPSPARECRRQQQAAKRPASAILARSPARSFYAYARALASNDNKTSPSQSPPAAAAVAAVAAAVAAASNIEHAHLFVAAPHRRPANARNVHRAALSRANNRKLFVVHTSAVLKLHALLKFSSFACVRAFALYARASVNRRVAAAAAAAFGVCG